LSDLFGIWIPFALMGMLSLIMTGLLLAYRKKPIVSNMQ
jgi:hypothetical protein